MRYRTLLPYVVATVLTSSGPIFPAVADESSDKLPINTEAEALTHPYLNLKANEHVSQRNFNSNTILSMNEPLFPPGYPRVRLYVMDAFNELETEFVKGIAPRLVGKSQDAVLEQIGKPLVKSSPEPYGESVSGADEYLAYFFGFTGVRLTLAFSKKKCIAANVETSYKKMLQDQAAWKETVSSFALGRSKAEISAKFGGCEAAEAHNSQLPKTSWVIPSMRHGTFELKFDELEKCIDIEDWHTFH